MGERLQREEHRGGVVVDDQRVLGSSEPPQERLDVAVARAPLLRGEVELEVRVRGRDRLEALDRERAHERAAEVRVEHDTGGVDHGAEREEASPPRALHDAHGERVGRGRGRVPLARAPALGVQRLAHERGQPRAGDPLELGAAGERAEEMVDRGQATERGVAVSAHRARSRPSCGRGR